MRHNSSFGVRFPLILRGHRLLTNSLLNDALNDGACTPNYSKDYQTKPKKAVDKTPRSVTQG